MSDDPILTSLEATFGEDVDKWPDIFSPEFIQWRVKNSPNLEPETLSKQELTEKLTEAQEQLEHQIKLQAESDISITSGVFMCILDCESEVIHYLTRLERLKQCENNTTTEGVQK